MLHTGKPVFPLIVGRLRLISVSLDGEPEHEIPRIGPMLGRQLSGSVFDRPTATASASCLRAASRSAETKFSTIQDSLAPFLKKYPVRGWMVLDPRRSLTKLTELKALQEY